MVDNLHGCAASLRQTVCDGVSWILAHLFVDVPANLEHFSRVVSQCANPTETVVSIRAASNTTAIFTGNGSPDQLASNHSFIACFHYRAGLVEKSSVL